MRAHGALHRDGCVTSTSSPTSSASCATAAWTRSRGRARLVALACCTPATSRRASRASTPCSSGADQLTTTLADVADLPEAQRHALLRREIDEPDAQQVAARVSACSQEPPQPRPACRDADRAAAARSADCNATYAPTCCAHTTPARRASVAALRHVASCSACRWFRATALKHDRRSLRVLAPPSLLLGGALLSGKGGRAPWGRVQAPAGVEATAVVAAAVIAAGERVDEDPGLRSRRARADLGRGRRACRRRAERRAAAARPRRRSSPSA